ncbi:MAG: thiol-disulfide isomerase/thioredoxin [Spirosomataceae bacterium]|jgi:thiol-disulfide isomerase/thioredoxin
MYAKNIFLGTCLCILTMLSGCNSQSQETAQTTSSQPINTQEITWQPTIEAAFQQAKAEGKLVFVECYLPTCPVCISMEPFFKEPEVAKKYNSNFVNFKLDCSQKELVAFLDEKQIFLPSFPTFLFFDADGNLVHKDEVETSIASFNKTADKALNTNVRSSSFAKRFADGERSVPFLVDYASYSRVVRDTVANLAVASALYEIYPKDKMGTEESWKLTKKAVTDLDNGFAKYWFSNSTKAAEMEKEDGHAGNEQNILGGIIQSSLYSKRGKTYSSSKLQTIKGYMGLVGAAQYADGVTWEYEVNALIKEGKAPQAINVGNKMATIYATNGSAITYIVKVFNDVYPDKQYVNAAKMWLSQAKTTIAESQGLAEYHLESARMHQRNGDKASALADARLAQSNAVSAKLPLERFSALMNSLN